MRSDRSLTLSSFFFFFIISLCPKGKLLRLHDTLSLLNGRTKLSNFYLVIITRFHSNAIGKLRVRSVSKTVVEVHYLRLVSKINLYPLLVESAYLVWRKITDTSTKLECQIHLQDDCPRAYLTNPKGASVKIVWLSKETFLRPKMQKNLL